MREAFRINKQIRARSVQLIDVDGTNRGTVPLDDALKAARAADLDLVEVSPGSSPPVCKVMDWGKHQYQQKRAAKKHRPVVVKQVKFRPGIGPHDRAVKVGKVRQLLEAGHQVKVIVMLRGRQIGRPEIGVELASEIVNDVEDLGQVDGRIVTRGRDVHVMFHPNRT